MINLFRDELILQWGPWVSAGVMWTACGFALAEAVVMGYDPVRRSRLRAEFLRSLPWAVALAFAQLGILVGAMFSDVFYPAAGAAVMYLIFALLAPALWATGRVWAAENGMPVAATRWPRRARAAVMAGLVVAGVGLSLLLVTLVTVRPGEAVTSLRADGASDMGMILLVVWLVFNAPWQEELIFRHYLVARLGSSRGQTGIAWRRATVAVVLMAVVFSLGHAGHMNPAWPKLVQTFLWGLMLGGARVWLGTGYAVALHLLLNMSAPIVAPFLAPAL